jgi:hypothetical protein
VHSDGLEASLTPFLLLHILCDLRGLRVREATNLHRSSVPAPAPTRCLPRPQLDHRTRARVAVAAAIVGYPLTVILDKPTSGTHPALLP